MYTCLLYGQSVVPSVNQSLFKENKSWFQGLFEILSLSSHSILYSISEVNVLLKFFYSYLFQTDKRDMHLFKVMHISNKSVVNTLVTALINRPL